MGDVARSISSRQLILPVGTRAAQVQSRRVAIFDVPQRFSEKWVHDKVPTMDSTEFHAMFHGAATRGWDEDELRRLARMWSEESGAASPGG
jgi:hypothetical protein